MDEIFVNDRRMDTSEGYAVQCIYNSPYFTDIDSIVSNRTTQVELPKTANNLRAIEQSDLPNEGRFPFYRHRVLVKRDGIQLFSGWGNVTSITPTAIKMAFYWGNISAFKRLLDAKLADMQTAEDYIGYSVSGTTNYPEYYPNGWRSPDNWGSQGEVQPIMSMDEIFSRIADTYGISFTFDTAEANPFGKFNIPITRREADAYTREEQGVVFNGTTYADETIEVQVTSGTTITHYLRYMTAAVQDVNNLNAAGRINVEGMERITVSVNAGLTISGDSALEVYGLGDNIVRRLHTFKTTNGVVTATQSATVSVDGISEVVVAIEHGSFTAPTATIITAAIVRVYDADLQQLTFGEGALIGLYSNLPDWSVSQLLKNLMKMCGVFAYATSDTAITFTTIGKLYERRAVALDWTDKLSNVGDAPTEKLMSFGNYSQRNWCRYADDDTVQGDYSGYLVVQNAALEAEGEIIRLDFAATDGNRIPVWQGGEWQDVQPRILWYDGEAITFKGLSWYDLLRKNYYNYQMMIEYPRTIKTTVRLTTAELAKIDPLTPIYARQWGHYYAVMKATAKADNMVDVELLRMGRATTYRTAGDAEYLLELQQTASGYTVTLPNETAATIQQMIESDDYHVAVFRYGYTRRGEHKQRYNRFVGNQWTKTDRKGSEYRKYRKQLRYRMIGHDILQGGSLAGQAATSARYTDATLIFEIGDTITLPLLTSGGTTRLVTSKGRVRNTAANGLANLYVALVKRYNPNENDDDVYNTSSYGWVAVSNMLQVRGISDDGTAVWEFTRENLVFEA